MNSETMEMIEAIRARHSVRQYIDKSLETEKVDHLKEMVERLNCESGLHIQLVVDEPRAFDCRMAHYGKFTNVRNYFAMVGKKDRDLDEKVGYYGEQLVLEAQRIGLNTCWVGLSYKKIPEAIDITDGERLVCVIAVGYGASQGVAHKSKSIEKVTKTDREMPDWFRNGTEAALLAPTAINQQKFRFILHGEEEVELRSGIGFYSKVDKGIVRLHFEIGAGNANFRWKV